MRKLLLGDDFVSSGDDDKPTSNNRDDFFMDDSNTKNSSDDNDGDEPQNMSFSFVPNAKKEIEAMKSKKRAEAGLVCSHFVCLLIRLLMSRFLVMCDRLTYTGNG